MWQGHLTVDPSDTGQWTGPVSTRRRRAGRRRWDHLQQVPSARKLRVPLRRCRVLHRNVLNVAPSSDPTAGCAAQWPIRRIVTSHVTHLRATRKSPQPSHRVARRAAPCRRWPISSLSTCREQAVGVRFMTQLTGVVKMIPSIEGPKRPTTPLFSQIGPLWPAPTKWPQRAPLLPSASANLANGRADSSDDGRPDASGDKRKQKKSGTDLWCVPGSRVCGTWLVGSGTRPGRRGRDADEQLATE